MTEQRPSKDQLAHELYGAIKYTPGKIISIHRELANRILTALRAENEPESEPAGYRVDYTAGTVEAFFFTSPGHLPLDLKGLEEDGRTNVRATPLYGAFLPDNPRRMRTAHPDVRLAAEEFIAALTKGGGQ